MPELLKISISIMHVVKLCFSLFNTGMKTACGDGGGEIIEQISSSMDPRSKKDIE